MEPAEVAASPAVSSDPPLISTTESLNATAGPSVSSNAPAKIAAAQKYKEAGNEKFDAGEYQKALQEWHQALLYVKGLNANSTSSMASIAAQQQPQATTEEQKQVTDILNAVRLNMAAALLKLGKAERALAECTGVIDGGHNQNPKGWYRRAQAYLALKEMDKAKADLLKAKELAPQDKAIQKDLVLIAQWEKDQEAKTRQLYQNMFK